MIALSLGLVAALFWGLHDFTIRRVGGKADVAAIFALVTVFGLIPLVPIALLAGGWGAVGPQQALLAVAAGLGAVCANVALYRAFTIGPVALVAPICGSYPVLSVLFAIARGREAGVQEWLAVLAVVAGVAIVARGEGGTSSGSRAAAIGWAALASVSFAVTFGLAQWSAETGAHMPVAAITRATALVIAVLWLWQRRPNLGGLGAIWPALFLMGLLDVGAISAVTLAGGLENAEYAAVASSIFGIVTILLAWRFLREPMRPVQWGGVALVFAGIAALGLS
ncbi:EamA family transporter [Paragemmobacter ruber]|uniref:EamA family transporter n=1 Tax=Paragemmobacter ruber TaxID=1985673 RepID=A0ABW9Y1J8_9RHOB|nr:DMT family transporter [Rhodobacter ruber]NBE06104.1 EamA family transporter [Rhodobacter ruber]